MRITLCLVLASGIIADGASSHSNYAHFFVHRNHVVLQDADLACLQGGMGRLAHLTGYDTRDKNSYGSSQLIAAIETVQKQGISKIWIGSIGDRPAPVGAEGLPFVLDVSQDTRINDVTLPGKLLTVSSIYSEYPVLCQSEEPIRPIFGNDSSRNHLQSSRKFRKDNIPHANNNLPTMPYILPSMLVSPMMTPNGVVGVIQPIPAYGVAAQPIQPPPQHFYSHQFAHNNVPRTLPQQYTNGAYQHFDNRATQPTNHPIPPSNDPLNVRIQKELRLILLGHHFKRIFSPSDIEWDEEMYDFSFGKQIISPYGRRDRIVSDEHAIVLPPRLRRKGLLIQHGMPLVPNVEDLARHEP